MISSTPANQQSSSILGIPTDLSAVSFDGILHKVFWSNDNGFCITKIGHVSCIGTIHEINIGAMYKLKGSFKHNEKRKEWQFVFTSHSYIIDSSNGLKQYLMREAAWVGSVKAASIVSFYGEDSIKVLSTDPSKVASQIGLSLSQAKELQKWAISEISIGGLKEKLYGIGLKPSQVTKIIKEYGLNSMSKLKENPYVLTEIHGFGFKTTDEIAKSLGVAGKSKQRIESATKFCLEDQCKFSGSTCIKISDLIRNVSKLTGVDQEFIMPIIKKMTEDEVLITDTRSFCEYMKKIDRKI